MKSGVILSCLYSDWSAAAELFRGVAAEFSQPGWNWPSVLVDDGSTEKCPVDFLNKVVGFSSVEVVALRRNVGHQRAIAIGLSHIFESKSADAVVVMGWFAYIAR